MAKHSAKKHSEIFNVDKIVEQFVSELSKRGGRQINIVGDGGIATAAKIEFAENYDRNYHLVKYNPNYEAVSHLVLHELMHLELVLDAHEESNNQLFTTNQSCSTKFMLSVAGFTAEMEKSGVASESIDKYVNGLVEGINNQAYNTPIDLFIEDKIYSRYPEIRPIQFLSLSRIIY